MCWSRLIPNCPPGGGVPASHRHSDPDQGSQQDLLMGHHGRRIDVRLFRDRHEVGRCLRAGIPGSDHAGEILPNRGRFCGLILLNNIQNGEPLALINEVYGSFLSSLLWGHSILSRSQPSGQCWHLCWPQPKDRITRQ
jgi:hypothetical protein